MNTTIIYGKHPVIHALQNKKRSIIALYITEKTYSEIKEVFEFDAIKKRRIQIKIVDKKFLDKFCQNPGALHQGIAVLARKLDEIDIYDFLKQNEKKEQITLVALDQVTDPQNVGAILRNCAAFNVDGVILTKHHSPEENSIIAKTACGALDIVPIITVTNLSSTISLLKKHNCWSYGASLTNKDKQNISDIKFAEKALIIFGSEGRGLRNLTNEKIDYSIYIPMQNIDSLNVSSSSAIILFNACQN